MEMINRAIEDAAYAADFMRKIQGSHTSPHDEMHERSIILGNRAERRAAEKAQRKADVPKKVKS